MLQPVKSSDITETLSIQDGGELEDAIFLAVDKLEALCRVQAQLESSDGEGEVMSKTRAHYALVVEEQVTALRALLTDHFG